MMYTDEQLIAWIGAALAAPVVTVATYRIWRMAGTVSLTVAVLLLIQILVFGAMIALPFSKVYDTSIITLAMPIITAMHMWLNRNHYADRPGNGWKPRPWIAVGIVGFALIFADAVHSFVATQYGSPVVITSATTPRKTVHVGEPVPINYLFDRRRECPGTIYPTWYHPNGDVAMRMQPYMLYVTKLGYSRHTIYRQTVGLKPGRYYFLSKGLYTCEGREYPVSSLPVWVQIVERP